jgi:hypothetical protein
MPTMTLGRHAEHDPRSKQHQAAMAARLHDVMWEYHGQVLDQGDIGSCTGNSAVEVLMSGPYYTAKPENFTEKDALAVYELATTIDSIPGHYPPDDTGSSGLAVMKACKEKGYIRGYKHAFGIDHAMAALMLGPVITGVPWYEAMFHPLPDGTVRIGGAVAGGHEFTVLGYEMANDRVRCLNHWTAGWGDKGYFWMSKTTWARLLSEQGDVAIPVI